MKKKIINGIMMVALVAATSTSFVSCKDTNEDVKVELQNEYAALKTELEGLKKQYGDVEGRVSTLETKVANHAGDIATLQKEVDDLQTWLVTAFNNLIYNANVVGTYSNMLGSIGFPGVEPNVLVNNWGVAEADDQFPHNEKLLNEDDYVRYWATGDELGTTFTEGNNNAGFAGYIYANVNRYLNTNPMLANGQVAEKDKKADKIYFDFSLVNTAGEEVDVVKIVTDNDGNPTDEELEWGWTRAENNVFKFGVVYDGGNKTATQFKPFPTIELKRLKADLQKIWADRNSETITSKKALGESLADLYYNFLTKETNMKKYALKIAWNEKYTKQTYIANAAAEDGDVIKEGQKEEINNRHFVTTDYDIAFVTIKPLGFGSGDYLAKAAGKAKGTVNDVLEKTAWLQNKIYDQIKDEFPEYEILENWKLQAREYDETRDAIKGVLYHMELGDTWWIEIDGEPGYNANNKDVRVSDLIYTLNANVWQINRWLEEAEEAENKILNAKTVVGYLEKLTNRYTKVFQRHASQVLQPVLLYIDGNNNVNRVSGKKFAPYKADGKITLAPTTYNGDFLAPAYLKFVAIKSIDGKAATAADQPEGFGKIIFDSNTKLEFTPESGKIYEIVYEAVDYLGNVKEQSYFIQGK